MSRSELYDWTHQQERAHWDAQLEALGPVPCRRCHRPVHPDRDAHLNWDRRPWNLGHPDPHQIGKRPEHATCNQSAGGREGNRRKAATRAAVRSSMDWDA